MAQLKDLTGQRFGKSRGKTHKGDQKMDYHEFTDLEALDASAAMTAEQVINASRSVWRYVCKLSDALRNGDEYRASLAELALHAMDFTLRNLGFDSFLPADAQ